MLGMGRQFPSALEAVETLRQEQNVTDQFLPSFVIAQNGSPLGPIQDGDSVIFFNFRGDRALEICRAFEEKDFPAFDRKRVPRVFFAGMLQYDGDLKIPRNFLVAPPLIKDTLSQLLIAHGIKEYAVSETQKFGHVTYFWNGNRSEKFSEELENFEEIPSDDVPFDQRPWMQSAQITDALISALISGKYTFLRCNFPNGDMVGHTGNKAAVRIGVEAVDLALARLIKAAQDGNALLLVTADHGNADQMTDRAKDGAESIRTAHSLNPVPFLLFDPQKKHILKAGPFGLANVAATVAQLLDIPPYESWEEGMLQE